MERILSAKICPLLDSPSLSVDLRQAICALAEALSLVGVDEQQHGERVAFMAVECARQLHWSADAINDIFHTGLLHDCGVSSTRVHRHLVSEMDWEGAELHCVLGEYYLKEFQPLAHLAPVIRHHHTHWEQLQQMDLDSEVALAANLIYLVDRVDAIRAQQLAGGNLSLSALKQVVQEQMRRFSGTLFAPQLIDAFLERSKNDAFWLTLEPLNLMEYVHSMETSGSPHLTDYREIRQLATIFAQIVDAKSDFTLEHSVAVARLAVYLAQLLELPDNRIALIEIAALLHDLGKLGVPDEILEKAAPLTAEETAIMHRHSYDTYRILRHIDGFNTIAEWAGNHHETLVGDGYPFQLQHTELTIESRLIMVADIFQALAQDRPYRKGMNPQEIYEVLTKLVDEGKMDRELIALVRENLDDCWQVAISRNNEWLPQLVK